MKTIIFRLCAVALTLMSVASCKKENPPVYEDVDRVYFKWATERLREDQTNTRMISFGYDTPMKADSTITIPILVMGRTSDVDRPVAAALISYESTAAAGEDIEILYGVVPAGEIEGALYVKLHNTEKLSANTIQARMRLVPNEYFHVDWSTNASIVYNTTSGLEFNVMFDAKNAMPNLWQMSDFPTRYFGAWSRVKELAIYDALNVGADFFTATPTPANKNEANAEFNKRLPSANAYATLSVVGIVNRYLDRWAEEHGGVRMVDENGNEVKTAYPTYK